LDAAALMETVEACLARNVHAFTMIHDSYGTHAADSEILAATLRQVFLHMFGGDTNLLAQWMREVIAPVPLELQANMPSPPPMGTLDVNAVEQAKFFFA
ncbi:MAG: DNA-dependent RNA polymerase, partial [Desulfovibrionaceae bacterium]|nr:DNA-dependent RNA polymerase [Desulfovibrionaceae bacterium]